MKHLMIFETYKAQRELEDLASIVIRGLASKTYNWHERIAWKEPEEGDYHRMVNKYYRVKFKKPMSGFVDGANYLIDSHDGARIMFKGYNWEFKPNEIELTWSEANSYRYKLFVATTVKDAVGDKINKFDELREFIENTNIRYELEESLNNGTKGHLKHSNLYKKDMTITVYHHKNTLTELSKTRKQRLTNGREHTDSDIYFEIFNDLYSTTIHELQHAYDKYRSGGKSFNKQSRDYENRKVKADGLRKKAELEEKEKEFLDSLNKEYLNFPHEINARFAQAIQSMSFSKLVQNDEGHYRFEMLPLGDVLKSFKLHFGGYNILDEKGKRRLIRKVSQFWHLDKERVEQRGFNESLKLNESAIHMAYHVTSKHNLESIMKNGLEARVPEDYGENGDDKGVYLFKTIDDAKTALGQWLGWRIDDWEEETGKQYDEVLLHVNITGLECLDTVEFEWTCLEDIPADRIMSVDYEV